VTPETIATRPEHLISGPGKDNFCAGRGRTRHFTLKNGDNPADAPSVNTVPLGLWRYRIMRIGWTDRFERDLTDEQKRLCRWVADQARAGVTRIYYHDAQATLGIQSPTDLTGILRSMRERLDDIHAMVQSPMINTNAPYFDIHQEANHIWDSYCCVEGQTCLQEAAGRDLLHCAAGRD
jgi:hypothetical protein